MSLRLFPGLAAALAPRLSAPARAPLPHPERAGVRPAAQLSQPGQAMIRTGDAEQERTVAMLEKWVNQNSGTMNRAGVKAVGDMARAELEPLGERKSGSAG